MIIREIVKMIETDFIQMLCIYDYYPLERKLKVYVQILTTLQLKPFGTGKVIIKSELPEFKGEAFNVDGCQFLDDAGDDNKTGHMVSIEFVKVNDE